MKHTKIASHCQSEGIINEDDYQSAVHDTDMYLDTILKKLKESGYTIELITHTTHILDIQCLDSRYYPPIMWCWTILYEDNT